MKYFLGSLILQFFLSPVLASTEGYLNSVTFISTQSKTSHNEVIVNRVKLVEMGSKKIWIMNQSPLSKAQVSPPDQWDRLAIVVDDSTSPSAIEYFQLKPMKLDLKLSEELTTENLERSIKRSAIPLKATCLNCHSHGPRLLVPFSKISGEKLSPIEGSIIKKWNRLIRDQKPVRVPVENFGQPMGDDLWHPLADLSDWRNQELKLWACNRCHNSDQRPRSVLTRSNFDSIKFELDQGLMPSDGKTISQEERTCLNAWLEGKLGDYESKGCEQLELPPRARFFRKIVKAFRQLISKRAS